MLARRQLLRFAVIVAVGFALALLVPEGANAENAGGAESPDAPPPVTTPIVSNEEPPPSAPSQQVTVEQAPPQDPGAPEEAPTEQPDQGAPPAETTPAPEPTSTPETAPGEAEPSQPTVTPGNGPVQTPPGNPATAAPAPPPANLIIGSGSIDGLSLIWGGLSFPVSQEYGHTEFSLSQPALYLYGSDFGLDGRAHPGLDIGMPAGTRLYSPVDGIVIVSGGTPFFTHYGNGSPGVGELLIQTDAGEQVILGHMSAIVVGVGERVTVGQFVGVSGGQNGDHLHLETRVPTAGGYVIVDPRWSFLIPAIAAYATVEEVETSTETDDQESEQDQPLVESEAVVDADESTSVEPAPEASAFDSTEIEETGATATGDLAIEVTVTEIEPAPEVSSGAPASTEEPAVDDEPPPGPLATFLDEPRTPAGEQKRSSAVALLATRESAQTGP